MPRTYYIFAIFIFLCPEIFEGNQGISLKKKMEGTTGFKGTCTRNQDTRVKLSECFLHVM